MLLAVDIGNTNICIGLLDGPGHSGVRSTTRMVTRPLCTADEYAAELKFLLDRLAFDVGGCEGVVLCSVVPGLTGTLAAACRRLTGRGTLLVHHTLDTGLTFAVPAPERLGQDRIADAAAAAALYPLPLMTVDLGTATTCNVVDAEKRFLGGIILPGVQTGLRALSSGTAQLPNIAPEAGAPLIGTDTVGALASGAIHGTAAMLDGLAARVDDALGAPLTVVATGGLAPAILPQCRRTANYDPDLLFKGLALLWQKNAR